MTLNDLIKLVPITLRDALIEIYIPCVRPGDEGTFPLIQIEFDQKGIEPITIILIADAE